VGLRKLEKGRGFELFQEKQRLEYVPGAAGAEAAKLEKFSDGSRTQIQWLPDVARADFCITLGIKLLT
jgi:hypothetical protein